MTVAYSQKTFITKKADVTRDWHVIDATGNNLGRMSNKIAVLLMGKHKPSWTPHVDDGDFVIILNVAALVVTGRKFQDKIYEDYSGWPSGKRIETFESLQSHHPEKILKLAVRRMLPKTRLGRAMLKKLKIYQGSEHPHVAQQPKPYRITYGRKEALGGSA